jgi:glycosyltransferase involved in cell wall biosynthesis
MRGINYRLGLEQRLFPEYRKPFFDLLASRSNKRFCLFVGKAQPGEGILEGTGLQNGKFVQANNRYLIHGKRYFFHQENFLAWLEDWNPQVLIVEANPRHLGLNRGIKWMHERGGKVIGWGLGTGGTGGFLARFRKGFRKSFVQNFDVLISYSQKGKSKYIEAGFPAERIFIASNAVSPRPSWSLPRRVKDFSHHKPVVLFVGRLLERKSVDHLIQACAKISKQDQPELVIVGDGPARSNLEALAKQVYPATRFTGDLRGKELADAYKKADLFVLPGTGGLAVQQAMSYGLPVVTGVGDGTQSDLVREDNGWQLRTDTIEELTVVLENTLKDPIKMRKMGEASFEIVKNEVNLEAMVEIFVKAVEFTMNLDKKK